MTTGYIKRLLLVAILVATPFPIPNVFSEEAPAKTPIALILHKKNPVEKLTSAQVRDLFLKRRQNWEGGLTVVPINHAIDSKISSQFNKLVLKMTDNELANYWVKQSVTGQTTPPQRVSSQALAKRLVATLPGAISYIELDLVDDSVKVVAVDGMLPNDPQYPFRY